MVRSPVVSVVMPVYNAASYLEAAVESILNQTFGDFEFLVLDDGSTDKSPAIMRRYQELDSRITFAQRPHEDGNYVTALNQLVESARGEYIARMDADDIAKPERFDRQVAYLRAHPEVVAVSTRVLVVDKNLWPIWEMGTEVAHDRIDEAHLRAKTGQMIHPAVMIRASALCNVGGYRVEYAAAEDFDLWLRLAEVGSLANLPEVLLYYRVHDQNVGHTRHALQWSLVQKAVEEARSRRGLPGVRLPSMPVPVASTLTQLELFSNWCWWALGAGHLRTARKYALLCVRKAPLSLNSWRKVYCVLRAYHSRARKIQG
jgi:glycosyltransferase involved in cell wall biosynthesis